MKIGRNQLLIARKRLMLGGSLIDAASDIGDSPTAAAAATAAAFPLGQRTTGICSSGLRHERKAGAASLPIVRARPGLYEM